MIPNKFALTINGIEEPRTFTKDDLCALMGQTPYQFQTNGIEIKDGSVFELFFVEDCADYTVYNYHTKVSQADFRSELIGTEGSVRIIEDIICTVSFTQYSGDTDIHVELSEHGECRQVPDLRLVV